MATTLHRKTVAVDTDEEALREAKENEMRKKRHEENRQAERAREAELQKQKLSKAKEDLNNKPYTYDSSGNILWVQPLNTQATECCLAARNGCQTETG